MHYQDLIRTTGAVAAALIFATADTVNADGTAIRTSHERLALSVPGEVPSGYVGPLDDGDPSTEDPAITFAGARDFHLVLSTGPTKALFDVATHTGKAGGCPKSLLNQELGVTLREKTGTLKLEVRFTHVDGETGQATQRSTTLSLKGTPERHSWRIPVCVRA